MSDLWEKLALAGVVLVLAAATHGVAAFLVRRTFKALAERPTRRNDDLGGRARALLAKASGASAARQRQRIKTVGSMSRNVVGIVIWVVAGLTCLSIFGIPLGPIVASAGIGGVALAFGAQSLVKDYLSGLFMLAEDQFGVGDLIKVDQVTGTVQEVTLRITKVRDGSGTIWYFRNGEVLTVGNVSQGYSTATVDIPVAIDEDPDRVQEILRRVVAEVAGEEQWSEVLLEDPTVLGVTSMVGGTMTLGISLKTGPDKQWGVSREIRAKASKALAAAGIRGPILGLTATEQAGPSA